MHSFNFDKAVNLSQRIFMERGDIESLNLALLNLRLSWLKTIVESFDLWLEALPGSYNNSEQVSFTRIIIPDYIRGIYLTDIQDGSMNVLYTNTSSDVQDLKIPSSKESLPRIVIDRMHHWIVSSQCGNKSVALLIDNRIMDEQEKYLLSSIGREPSDSKLWELLTAYEEESGARLLAQFGTLLAGATMGIKGNKEVDCFGNLLLNRGDIAYVIYQNPDGIIEYNNGFDNKKAEYNNNDWQKSSRTTALYIIELKYENKNTREITNPVFKNNRWEGVLRIGMLKQ